jgi:hypothetical protein
MDEHVRDTLFGLCNFFDVITRKSIGVRQLKMLQDEIVVILCELEIYFPPAFCDICVHLLLHVVDDIRQLGPTFLHNMMPFERQNCVMKEYVRNRARPDASMAKDTFATGLFWAIPRHEKKARHKTRPGTYCFRPDPAQGP